jgi:hypothetical protein
MGSLLYVGKAKSLRSRLASYWRSSPTESRKLDRIRRRVVSIQWRETESEKAALLLENVLLRERRPFFNVMNTRPERYPYLLLQERKVSDTLRFCRCLLASSITNQESGDLFYGAFRSRRLATEATKVLFELFEIREGCFVLEPSQRPRRRGWATLSSLEVEKLHGFFEGTSSDLIADIYQELWQGQCFEDPLLAKRLDGHFSLLRNFFEQGPRRNRVICEELGLESTLIEQTQLDDLLVEMHFRDRIKDQNGL